MDRQQPRGARSAPARCRKSSGSSNDELLRNLSLLCGSGVVGARRSSSRLTHPLGCTSVFLGAVRIFARCGGRIWSAAFGHFLEHRADRYGALRHRAFSLTVIDYAEQQRSPQGRLPNLSCFALGAFPASSSCDPETERQCKSEAVEQCVRISPLTLPRNFSGQSAVRRPLPASLAEPSKCPCG